MYLTEITHTLGEEPGASRTAAGGNARASTPISTVGTSDSDLNALRIVRGIATVVSAELVLS